MRRFFLNRFRKTFFKRDCIFAGKIISCVYLDQKRDARPHKYFLCFFFHPRTRPNNLRKSIRGCAEVCCRCINAQAELCQGSDEPVDVAVVSGGGGAVPPHRVPGGLCFA